MRIKKYFSAVKEYGEKTVYRYRRKKQKYPGNIIL